MFGPPSHQDGKSCTTQFSKASIYAKCSQLPNSHLRMLKFHLSPQLIHLPPELQDLGCADAATNRNSQSAVRWLRYAAPLESFVVWWN